MRNLFFLMICLILQGCVEEEEYCKDQYIYDYEYKTLDDGSVIAGKPIYKCRL